MLRDLCGDRPTLDLLLDLEFNVKDGVIEKRDNKECLLSCLLHVLDSFMCMERA